VQDGLLTNELASGFMFAQRDGVAIVESALSLKSRKGLMRAIGRVQLEPLAVRVGKVEQAATMGILNRSDWGHCVLSLAESITAAASRGALPATPFEPNEAMYQHYQRPSSRIGPHVDSAWYVHFIVVASLEGEAFFWVDDPPHAWRDRTRVVSPGDVVILRGASRNAGERPRHAVGPPLGVSRTSLTFRQREVSYG
jgi:hypothetical protein